MRAGWTAGVGCGLIAGMPYAIDEIVLAQSNPGTRRTLRIHRFGQPGAGTKAYIQAALHADEIPGLLVAQHLLTRLKTLEEAGAIRGEIVVVPMANPIGLDQWLNARLHGRFALANGVNFNRSYAELSQPVADAVSDQLGSDAATNVALIRAALREACDALPVVSEADSLRKTLLSLAADADVVLDLHCDSDAVMHLYTTPEAWPGFQDLAGRLGCLGAFLAEVSGGEPFDEACSGLWWHLRRLIDPALPIPAACNATTIELRGVSDVFDPMADADASAIIDHLMVRGIIAGEPPPPPAACAGTPLAGVDRVKAPCAGVVVYHAALGDLAVPGQMVAEVLDPSTGERHPCRTVTEGIVWARLLDRYCQPGDWILKTAGHESLVPEGTSLLSP